MTHWDLEALADVYREKHGIKPAIQPPTDDEFDEWKAQGEARRRGKDQKPEAT